ncbi:unnamed protein product [Rotaria sp. Silwood1]|nr:unnamed protein product [Rotaria sp. Silwood1]CAF0899252.1 unnamed protein product [Rotaria sp. Silwood1]
MFEDYQGTPDSNNLPVFNPLGFNTKLKMNIECTYFFFGNGYVMNQFSTAQIFLIAKTNNIPVVKHKFFESVQIDSFISNKLDDQSELTSNHSVLYSAMLFSSSTSQTSNSSKSNLNSLDMTCDVIPSIFISTVITELGILS